MRSPIMFISPLSRHPHVLDHVSVSACVGIDEIHTVIDGQVLIAHQTNSVVRTQEVGNLRGKDEKEPLGLCTNGDLKVQII